MVKLYKNVWHHINDEQKHKDVDYKEQIERKPQDTCPDHWFEYVFIIREIGSCWSCYLIRWFNSITGRDICKYHEKQLEENRNKEDKCEKCFNQPYKYIN